MAALKTADLQEADSLTSVQDKFGVNYVKLDDGSWLSNELNVVGSKALVKRRVFETGGAR